MSTTENKIGATQAVHTRASGYPGGRFVTLLAIVALVFSAFLLVPFDPRMPKPGLDPSWRYAVNDAVANHLVFGRDFIFTFGPLGSVYTYLYHPSIDHITLVSASVIALGVASGFALLAFSRGPLMLWLLPVVILITRSGDAYFMSLPLCLLLASLLVASKNVAAGIDANRKGTLVLFGVLTCAIGLLPIIKGSLAGVAGSLGVLSVVILARSGHVRLAACVVALSVAALCAGWTLSGQPLYALPDFFRAQGQIISGYSDAMAIDGPGIVVIIWAVPAALILAIFYSCIARREGLNGWLATAGLAAFLFITYKSGFVRQDGHPGISMESLLFAGLAVAMILKAKQALVAGVIAFAGWGTYEGAIDGLTLTYLRERVVINLSQPVAGIRKRVTGQLEGAYATANDTVRRFYQLPPISGTVDVYPVELAAVFANHLQWAGRPVIQSYAAYTPSLAEVNARHLLADNAPQNVLIGIAPIDNHLSTLEDAPSWPLLLTSYSVMWENQYFLGLKRDHSAHAPRMVELSRTTASLNQPVSVPQTADPVTVRIDMAPSLRGKLRSISFRPETVYIDLYLSDGTVVRRRYIPTMGTIDFLLSPYIASNEDYLALAAGIHTNVVQRFSIVTTDASDWRPSVHLTFSTFALPRQPSARKLFFTAPTTPPPVLASSDAFPKAQCNLDVVNGSLVQQNVRVISASGDILKLDGWAAPSASAGIAPDEIWARMNTASERPRFYRTQLLDRPDVGRGFGHPDLGPVGFTVKIDMANLTGEQNLAIFAVRNGQAFDCGITQIIAPDLSGAPPKG